MGAWIETFQNEQQPDVYNVAPRVGAWIETGGRFGALGVRASHPVWVRGLKPLPSCTQVDKALSHPVWVRGLKLGAFSDGGLQSWVAPRVGAWIETCREG